MNASFRATLTAGALTILLGVLLYHCPELPDRTTAAIKRTDEESALEKEARLQKKLEVDLHILTGNMVEKWSVVDRVIQDGLPLVEAAALFRDINARRPPHLPFRRTQYPGGTEEESLCREVIAFAQTRLKKSPDKEGIAARTRLGRELQAFLDCPCGLYCTNTK